MSEKIEGLERTAEAQNIEDLTFTGTVRLTFQIDDELPFRFEPGQHVTFQTVTPSGTQHRRDYAIFSPPSEEQQFTILVRTIQGGDVSTFLSCLTEGDVVNFGGPGGNSMLPYVHKAKNLVILVTGVGISPIHSLLQHLLPMEFGRRVQLYWGLRLIEDVCLRDELDSLAETYSHFHYQISLSDPAEEWNGLHGRVTESVPPLLNQPIENRYILCGNGGMINEMRRALQAVGVSDRAIYREYFFNRNYAVSTERVNEIVPRFGS